ncbi:hypothetical protein N0V93_001242 [Gnomoniopsis smithogilvyi]|uniref:Fungal lipase-type domain-containing protein n=1 Tax=Gnomoniopsis smithogilvyi TaxID=1191159 RepID=A0A9W8Z3D6_9PEZI|nr:hypothetical protein N0V93_001242 [Gnomoniopsis smithogilvyi]
MRPTSTAFIIPLLNLITAIAALSSEAETIFQRLISSPFADIDNGPSATSISPSLFTDIERLARLVDITYCVGTSGIYQPFTCASRCKEFPNLRLASTWNTGVLLSDSCGYVAVDEGSEDGKEKPAIIVAFRGTYSLANTVVDLSTVPQEYVPYPDPGDGGNKKPGSGTESKCANCTVHMGFLESWRQARKLVLPVLKNARAMHSNYPIRIVGHSLGGAVACLAALELKLALGWDDVTVTTFGEPQVGNVGFVDFVDKVFGLMNEDSPESDLEKRTYRRVTHVDDPVPLLPLSEWGYRPHGGEVFITKQHLSPGLEDLRLCRGDEDPACIAGSDEGLLGVPSRLKLWQLLFAHRDYFWRLGLCVPGGDPSDWGRPPYNVSDGHPDEL